MLLKTKAFVAILSTVSAYNGGVAIRYPNTTCPRDTFYIGSSFAANCCPDGTYGAPKGSSYCCPSSSDCGTTVENIIQCANSSWTYFPSPDNQAIGFCCLPDWVGYVQLDSAGDQVGVACGTPGYEIGTSQSTVPSIKLAQSTVTSTPTTTTTPATVSATTTTTSSATATSDSTSPSSGGLSKGAQVGIGVGVSIGALAIIGALAAWYIIHRRRTKRVPETSAFLRPELSGEPIAHQHANEKAASEVPAVIPPQELSSVAITHELPTDWQGYEGADRTVKTGGNVERWG